MTFLLKVIGQEGHGGGRHQRPGGGQGRDGATRRAGRGSLGLGVDRSGQNCSHEEGRHDDGTGDLLHVHGGKSDR